MRHCPTRFCDHQHLKTSIDAGPPEERRLELDGSIAVIAFVQELCRLIENHGLDTVFRVVAKDDKGNNDENYLLVDWG